MAHYVRTRLQFRGTPEELRKIVSDLMPDSGTEAVSFEKILPLCGKEPEEVWGVSSDAEETDRILYRNETCLEYTFDTERKAPVKVYEELAKRYPGPDMRAEYAYEDYGENCGIYEAGPGKAELVFREPEDPFEFACGVWDADPDEERAERSVNFYEE